MKQFILRHKLLCILIACVIVIGAVLGIVLPTALKHEHTFSEKWSFNGTSHWHQATCKHSGETTDTANHDFGEWSVKTPAGVHVDRVETRTCKVCGYEDDKTIENTATHAYSEEWSSDDDSHWKESTCEGHDPALRIEESAHSGDWTEETPAGLHTDRVDERTCSVCGKHQTKTVEGTATHAYSDEWSSDENSHWKESTCEGHDPALRIEESAHSGDWTEKTPAGYGVDRVDERTCSVCGKHQTKTVEGTALPAKDNVIDVDTIDFTYNGSPRSIEDLIEASNVAGIVIKYRGTGTTTYEESTVAPVNAGTYEYTVTVPATSEWKIGEASGQFEIKKFRVRCPDVLITNLPQSGGKTKKLCDIDISDEDIGTDEIPLVYGGTNTDWLENGVGAGRIGLSPSSVKIDPSFEANFQLYGLPTGSSATIQWVVKDTSDKFSLKIASTIDTNYYQGTILHGSVEVGDELLYVGTVASGRVVKIGVTVQKIEYHDVKNNNKYYETTVATKGEVVKMTFAKKDASAFIQNVDYVVSVKDMGTINQYQRTKSIDGLSFDGSEYRVFGLTVQETDPVKITVNSDYASLTVYNANTGEVITLTDNSFQLTESAEVIIIIKQKTTKGTIGLTATLE